MVNTYILAPNFSTAPPPTGPLDLGHILVDLTEFQPLNRKSRIPPAAEDVLPVDAKLNFQLARGDQLKVNPGIFASFLSVFGVGVEAGTTFERSADDTFHIDQLETIAFNATDLYVRESVKALPVQMYLEESRYKAAVYMITGMKIARGAALETARSRNVGGRMKIGFSYPGVPLDIGPDIDVGKTKSENISYDASSDFILAIRVRKVKYKGPRITHAPYLKGASMMGEDTETDEVVGLGLEDGSSLEDFGLSESFVMVQHVGDKADEDWIVPKTSNE